MNQAQAIETIKSLLPAINRGEPQDAVLINEYSNQGPAGSMKKTRGH